MLYVDVIIHSSHWASNAKNVYKQRLVKLKLTAHLITKILSLNVTNSKYYGFGYTLFFNNKSLELNRKIGYLVQRR